MAPEGLGCFLEFVRMCVEQCYLAVSSQP